MYFHSLVVSYKRSDLEYESLEKEITDGYDNNETRLILEEAFGTDFIFAELFDCIESAEQNSCIGYFREKAGVSELDEFLSFLLSRVKGREVIVPMCDVVRQ